MLKLDRSRLVIEKHLENIPHAFSRLDVSMFEILIFSSFSHSLNKYFMLFTFEVFNEDMSISVMLEQPQNM